MKDAARVAELSQGINAAFAKSDREEKNMTGTALYELANIREALDAVIAENEGELDAALEKALDEITGAFDEKAERVALYIRERHALAKAIKEEEDRLAARKDALLKTAATLTKYLHTQMERVGRDKINGLLCTIAVQKNPPSVVELLACDEADLRNVAQMYEGKFIRRVPEQWSWDRKAIIEAAKAGPLPEDLAKRVSVVQGTSLRIR